MIAKPKLLNCTPGSINAWVPMSKDVAVLQAFQNGLALCRFDAAREQFDPNGQFFKSS